MRIHTYICVCVADRRKWDFIRGTPEKRLELHASVYPEVYRRRDLLLSRTLDYQKRQESAAETKC